MRWQCCRTLPLIALIARRSHITHLSFGSRGGICVGVIWDLMLYRSQRTTTWYLYASYATIWPCRTIKKYPFTLLACLSPFFRFTDFISSMFALLFDINNPLDPIDLTILRFFWFDSIYSTSTVYPHTYPLNRSKDPLRGFDPGFPRRTLLTKMFWLFTKVYS